MFQNILVALDRDGLDKPVFDQSLALAKPLGAKLMLLHVLYPEEEGKRSLPLLPDIGYSVGMSNETWEIYRQEFEALRQQNLLLLQSYAAEAEAMGVRAEFTQNSGNPGQVICDLASAWRADLIVMGHRGRSGLTELLLGSVSNYVFHHASCSLLTISSQAGSQGTSDELVAALPDRT